jgi:hypothetical protein
MSKSSHEKKTVYEVLSPVGQSTGKILPLSPSIPDLNGRTICEIGRSYRSDETFPMLEQLLRQQFPAVKFVHNNEMPDSLDISIAEITNLANLLQQKGCDVLLSGNGA